MYLRVLPVCLSVYHVPAVRVVTREGFRSSCSGVIAVNCLVGVGNQIQILCKRSHCRPSKLSSQLFTIKSELVLG